LSLCLTNYALRYEDVWSSGRIDPRILDSTVIKYGTPVVEVSMYVITFHYSDLLVNTFSIISMS
jgi:hypothetical protein